MSEFPLQSLLERLLRILDASRIDYMVMGGVAVRFWGIPRPTYDLDFTIAVESQRIPAFCGVLQENGFSVSEAHTRGFADRLAGMKKFAVTGWVGGKPVGVDLFLVTTRYQAEAFARRSQKKINGRTAWMISAEDLILHKLIAGRERDLADVSDVLGMNPEVDRNYLRRWGGELGVAEALERKLGEADMP